MKYVSLANNKEVTMALWQLVALASVVTISWLIALAIWKFWRRSDEKRADRLREMNLARQEENSVVPQETYEMDPSGERIVWSKFVYTRSIDGAEAIGVYVQPPTFFFFSPEWVSPPYCFKVELSGWLKASWLPSSRSPKRLSRLGQKAAAESSIRRRRHL